MDTDGLVRTIITLVVGGGGVGWLSAFLSRRGQREENSNQRVANEAQARLAEAVEDREQLKDERDRNDELHKRIREAEDRAHAREVEIRRQAAQDLRECQDRCDRERTTLQTTFEAALRSMSDDLATLRQVTVGQVQHVAQGGDPATVPTVAPTLDDDDDLGV